MEIQLNGLAYHESRTNSYRAQDDNDQGPVESTPLIHRFPASSIQRQRGPLTAAKTFYLQWRSRSCNRKRRANVAPHMLTLTQFKAMHLVRVQIDTGKYFGRWTTCWRESFMMSSRQNVWTRLLFGEHAPQ
ncbi:hypothetical protein MSG28_001062 [Choristoneura fumiferana]|uniref:Uncharacterized protein n=1 Tax=Choristoneura fumiferana TaxID=7141 RepID=A0ACC0K3H3_CHOFU|nr:hypothetical protein MSG28_001062 [Choristoneura fumiferana]